MSLLTGLGVVVMQASAAIEHTECKGKKDSVLLITGETLIKAWQPFADWKTSIGKPTKIISVKEIGEKYQGKDIQEKIRHCVLDHAAKQGTKWVVLGGDSLPGGKGLVPDRDSKHQVYGRMRYADIPSDSYYLSEKSWDANNDGIYGDWANDKSEISYVHSTAVLGRIPVRTPEDVAAYTKKVISFESKYPIDDYANSMVYTCTVKASCPKLHTSWDNVKNVWGGKGKHYFSHETPWDKAEAGDHDLSPENWVDMINNRSVSKLHMHGHGHLPVWVLENHKAVSAKTLEKLKNKNAYLCMTTVSCFTGQFDAVKDPSITESILRQPEAGAVMIIAPAREGVPIFHNPREDMRKMVTEGKMDGTTTLMTSFWKHGLSKPMTAGEAFHFAKSDMVADAEKTSGYHWCLSELNFLGDPTLGLRAKPPIASRVDVKNGAGVINVETNLGEGKTVTLWQRGNAYLRVKTDAAGAVKITLPKGFQKKEKFSVAVAGYGVNAFVKLF